MAYKYRGSNHEVEEDPKPWRPTAEFVDAKCGTYARYTRHQRSEVPPCEACKAALADYMNNYRAKRRLAA